jgi:regulatory protein
MVMGLNNQKKWTRETALSQIQRFCAYQERCHEEVRQKLLQHGIYGDFLEELIVSLIENNFLNEERFAIQYAGGKFRIKKWGKNKIKAALKQKNNSDYCIRESLKQISNEEYLETISYWVQKKSNELHGTAQSAKKYHVYAYLVQKGFEPELINQVIGSSDLQSENTV